MTYQEATTVAQSRADATGFDQGIEASPYTEGGFRAFPLPRRVNRQGYELRCEVRSCSDLSRCALGHGPSRRVGR